MGVNFLLVRGPAVYLMYVMRCFTERLRTTHRVYGEKVNYIAKYKVYSCFDPQQTNNTRVIIRYIELALKFMIVTFS